MSPESKRCDLLLINPGGRLSIYQGLGEALSAVEPPVWAGLMATFVRRKGYAARILDVEAEQMSPEETARQVKQADPKLAVVVVYGHQPSASTQNMTAAGQICFEIKRVDPERKVLLVGGHVSALPDRTLREEEADFVCEGEGPVTIVGLLEALSSGQREDLRKVEGLWYREDGQVRSNPPAALIQDLDAQMPEVAWDLLPMSRYRAHNWHCLGDLKRQPYAAIYTTLGCPFHCSFCCIQAPFKSGERTIGYKESVNSYRFWSVHSIVDQLECLSRQYGVRNIKIADEMFVLNLKHVGALCDAIVDRGLDLNIWAYARVDTVRDEILDKLKAAGVNWLAFGIESANARVRDDVQKGFGQDLIFKTIGKVRAAGINVIGNYIFGLPEDDLDTMQETLNLAMELNCEFGNFYSAMAYPGSPLYALALKEGWPLPETWNGYSQHAVDTLPLPTKHLSAAEVLRFRDNAFTAYFTSPRYLEMVARKFGQETARHLREMASHRLVRKYVPDSERAAAVVPST